MTEASASATRRDPNAFVQAWVDGLAQVLEQVSGSPVPSALLAESSAELPAPGESDLWILGVCSGGLRGEMSLRIPSASTLRLARLLVSEPAAPAVELTNVEMTKVEPTNDVAAGLPAGAAKPTAEHREAVVELLRQVAGRVATALQPNWGEVQLRLDPVPGALSWPASSTCWLRVSEDSATLIEMRLSAALAAGLRAEKTDRVEVATPAAPAPGAPAFPTPEGSFAKLGLLMDVELALTLRFGSRRLLLHEVLDLNPGAVVELDRKVKEPVDVLLDGRLVARGEVVVLNGNYGVRVTEVSPVSP